MVRASQHIHWLPWHPPTPANACASFEADVVRRIFDLAAIGAGFKRIADRLNREQAPSPMPRRVGLPRGWAASSVGEALYRELYRLQPGSETEPVGHHDVRPESAWLKQDQPALRIVTDQQWDPDPNRTLDTTVGHAGPAIPRVDELGRQAATG